MAKKLLIPIIIVLTVFVLAGIPQLISVDGNGVVFNWRVSLDSAVNYLKGLPSGQSFLFIARKMPRNFLDLFPGYTLTSFIYLVIAAFLGLNLGIILGMFCSRLRSAVFKDAIGLFGIIPDFIIVLLLQRGVVYIQKATGIKVAKVVAMSLTEPAILLPLITMSLIPALYLIRTVSNHTDFVLSREYIQGARARGLAPLYIYLHHVFPNVLPFIKADMHKVAGMMLANLFIVEYLFNIYGITRALFYYGFQFVRYSYVVNYQYNFVVNVLFVIIFLYAALSLLMRGYILLLERKFCR
ncbi:MAG: ABC transporter permease subunit [Bacillota bacterium]